MAGVGQPVSSHQLRHRLPDGPPVNPFPRQNRGEPGGRKPDRGFNDDREDARF